jgi:hypothetical protein
MHFIPNLRAPPTLGQIDRHARSGGQNTVSGPSHSSTRRLIPSIYRLMEPCHPPGPESLGSSYEGTPSFSAGLSARFRSYSYQVFVLPPLQRGETIRLQESCVDPANNGLVPFSHATVGVYKAQKDSLVCLRIRPPTVACAMLLSSARPNGFWERAPIRRHQSDNSARAGLNLDGEWLTVDSPQQPPPPPVTSGREA